MTKNYTMLTDGFVLCLYHAKGEKIDLTEKQAEPHKQVGTLELTKKSTAKPTVKSE